jgi:hypothetical protein
MDNVITTLISLFVAIISHKWIEAFALGVAINKVQTPDLIPRVCEKENDIMIQRKKEKREGEGRIKLPSH